MQCRRLELHNPIVSTYTSYGLLFSILPEDSMPWVYNNFIQLRYAHDWKILIFSKHPFFLSNCSGLDYYIIPAEFVEDMYHKSFMELVVYAIDKGYYIMTYADRYYISQYEQYQKEHDGHEIIISGYDLDKQVVFVSDNLNDGRYITYECSVDMMEDAYWNLPKEYVFMSEVRFMKPRKNLMNRFNIRQVLDELKCYLNSTPSYDLFYHQEYTFGFEIFDILLDEISSAEKNRQYINLRAYHLLYEHKILMSMRVKFMEEKGYIRSESGLPSEFKELEKKYLILRNSIMKNNYLLARGKENFTDIKNMILGLVSEEKELIHNLIEEIEWNMEQS